MENARSFVGLSSGLHAVLTLLLGLICLLASPPGIAGTGEIERLFKLPEQEIDVGNASLVIAKELYPNIDVAAYSRQIDLLVQKARVLGKNTENPDQRIRVLNTLLYQIEGFHYDHSDSALTKLENHSLKGILDTKSGTCFTMPLLYLAVAQRLGYPVHAVTAPNHLFLRYVAPEVTMQNIEATSGGGYSPDAVYIHDMNVSDRGLKSGGYMQTLTQRQLLAYVLADTAISLFRTKGDLNKTMRYFELANRNYPQFPDFYDALAKVYAMQSNRASAEAAEQYRGKSLKFRARAEALGYVKPIEQIVRANVGVKQ